MLSGSAMIRIINTDRNSLCSFFLFSCLHDLGLLNLRRFLSLGWHALEQGLVLLGHAEETNGLTGCQRTAGLWVNMMSQQIVGNQHCWTRLFRSLTARPEHDPEPWRSLNHRREVLENEWQVTLMCAGWSRTSPPPGTMHLEGGAFSQAQKDQKTTETLDVFGKFRTWNRYILDYFRTFPSFCFSFDSHRSSLLCYPSLFLGGNPPNGWPYAARVCILTAQSGTCRLFISIPRRRERDPSNYFLLFLCCFFSQARMRLRRDSCSSVGPRRDDRQQFRRAGTLSLLHLCCEILLTESAQWALQHALHLILIFFKKKKLAIISVNTGWHCCCSGGLLFFLFRCKQKLD